MTMAMNITTKPNNKRKVSCSPMRTTEKRTQKGDSSVSSNDPVVAGTCAKPRFITKVATVVHMIDNTAMVEIVLCVQVTVAGDGSKRSDVRRLKAPIVAVIQNVHTPMSRSSP